MKNLFFQKDNEVMRAVFDHHNDIVTFEIIEPKENNPYRHYTNLSIKEFWHMIDNGGWVTKK